MEEILLGGAPVRFRAPVEAMESGIGMVHQEFMLLPGFRVAENIKLNREPTRPNPLSRVLTSTLETLDIPRIRSDSRRALDQVGMGIDEWIPLAASRSGTCSSSRSRARSTRSVWLLTFDEPTAVLTEGRPRSCSSR
jgi:simple sugar transport system ATP-binding protein